MKASNLHADFGWYRGTPKGEGSSTWGLHKRGCTSLHLVPAWQGLWRLVVALSILEDTQWSPYKGKYPFKSHPISISLTPKPNTTKYLPFPTLGNLDISSMCFFLQVKPSEVFFSSFYFFPIQKENCWAERSRSSALMSGFRLLIATPGKVREKLLKLIKNKNGAFDSVCAFESKEGKNTRP